MTGRTFLFVAVSTVAVVIAGCGILDPLDATFDDVEPARRYRAHQIRQADPPPGGDERLESPRVSEAV
ncbi:MAG: hypothetical protein ABEN55_08470, partial [Bradymonadaceae bacterium]